MDIQQSKTARAAALLTGNGLVFFELFKAFRANDPLVALWESGFRLFLLAIASFGLYSAYRMLTVTDDESWSISETNAFHSFVFVVFIALFSSPIFKSVDELQAPAISQTAPKSASPAAKSPVANPAPPAS